MSRLVTPFVPRLELDLAFARSVAPQTQNLSAYVFGPAAQLVRYSEASERANGLLGQFDPHGSLIAGVMQTAYPWPNRELGSSIDIDYTRLFVKDALLRYWGISPGTMTYTGLNQIRHPGVVFASGNGFSNSPAFGDRGVAVGDAVLVKGVADGSPFELATRVQGFLGDMSSASVGSAVPLGTNKSSTSVDVDVTADAGNSGDVTLTGSGANYEGYASGFLSETYTITVVNGSTGGDATTATLSVTSASGLDNQASVTPAAFGTAFAIGTRGFTITLAADSGDNLLDDESWEVTVTQDYTPPTVAISGTYGAADHQDRTYLIEVLQGAATESSPVIRVSDLQGRDIDRLHTLEPVDSNNDATIPVAVGSYGLSIGFTSTAGLVVGDKWTVTAVAAKPQQLRTIQLAHNLPEGVAIDDAGAAALDVTLYLVEDIEVPRHGLTAGQFNFEALSEEIRVRSNIEVTTPNWTVGGSPVALELSADPLFAGVSQLYVNYRAWLAPSVDLLSATAADDISELVSGPNDPDNPLKYGLLKASLTNEGRPIFFFNTGDPQVHGNWEAALRVVDDTRLPYGFCPLTDDTAVLDMVYGHVKSRSGTEYSMYRVGWFAPKIDRDVAVVSDENSTDGELVFATVTDNPLQSGTQYTLVTVTSGNIGFVDAGVRAGDTLRLGYSTDAWGDVQYTSHTIASVVNQSSLLLATGLSQEEAVPRRIQVHRLLTPGEYVTHFSSTISSRYPGIVSRIMPFDTLLDGNREVPSYFLSPVLAGLRSAFAPQQPMTRASVPGFTGIRFVSAFTVDQLNELATSGAFIVAPVVGTNRLAVRHAVTAGDWDDVNQREESVISNVHSNLAYLFDVMDPFIGRSTVNADTLGLLRAEIGAAGDVLAGLNSTPFLGGQLQELIILQLRQSPIAADSVLLEVEMVLNNPMNRIRGSVLVVSGT